MVKMNFELTLLNKEKVKKRMQRKKKKHNTESEDYLLNLLNFHTARQDTKNKLKTGI